MDFALAQMKCLIVISARVVLIKVVESYSHQISGPTHTLWLNVSQIYHFCMKQPVRAHVTACLCSLIILEMISSALMALSHSVEPAFLFLLFFQFLFFPCFLFFILYFFPFLFSSLFFGFLTFSCSFTKKTIKSLWRDMTWFFL